MKISLDWINEFVELPKDLSPTEMGMRLTLSTCEVEGVEETNAHMDQVSVVEITKVEPHPEADKLRLVSFNTGKGEARVVCGAPNVAPGMKVPFAPIGTTLPGGFTLEPKKIRGIMSEGMLCAEDELGLGNGHEGLLELPSDAPIGTSLADYMNAKKDVLLDIDNKSITHRPDLWGHYGMSREFAATFGKPLAKPFDEAWIEEMRNNYTNETPPVTIEVKPSACLGFMGVSVDGVSIKPSPDWMQRRLNACGMRPINNIVDISNYVMLEQGMPNHIFDRTTVRGGKIIVRENGEESTFTTLDEMERKMIPSDSMVCDMEGPSSIAGIMGGLTSSVKDETTQLFVEVANWDAAKIRHTSTRLGLRTDASQRYEKSLDSHQLERTVLRVVELLKMSCPETKVVGPLVSDGLSLSDPLVIDLTVARTNSILGTTLNQAEITSLLETLEYKVEASGSESMKVTVPSYRSTKDVEVDADLIEDVGRIYGYDKLIPAAPHNEITAVSLSSAKTMGRKIEDFMVYRGRALEIYSYPLTGAKLLEQANWNVMNENLVLANALNPESDRMRPSLVPSLLEKAALNQKYHSKYRLFEMGRSYLENEKDFSEDRHQLGIIFFDKADSPFMDVLNLMGDLLVNLGLNAQIQAPAAKFPNPLIPSDWVGKHPHEFLDVRVMGKTCGFVGTIHPMVARNFKIKGNLVMAILDITDFMERPSRNKSRYKPLAKFPGSTFDCTVVAETETPVADVLSCLKKVKLKELENYKIVDVYPLSETEKTVTIRSWFLDREKTLTPELVKIAEDQIVATLAKAGYSLKQG